MAQKDSFGKLVGIVSILVACLGLFGAYMTPTSASIIAVLCISSIIIAGFFEKIKPITDHETRLNELDKRLDSEKRINTLQSDIDMIKGAMNVMINKKGSVGDVILLCAFVFLIAFLIYIIFFQKVA